MTSLKNSVRLLGHLGADPEVFHFENGGTKVSFSMATNEYYKSKGGETKENTNWHRIIVFGKNAEFAEKFLAKGKQVLIEGKLTYRSYKDKTGATRYITEILAGGIELITKEPVEPAPAAAA